LYRETSGQIKEMPCRGSSRNIRRARKLFLKTPEHWYARLDEVASLPEDPWHEQTDELKRRYMRRFGLIAGPPGPEEVDWPGAWDILGGSFRYPQDIHFAYAAVADALEVYGCVAIIPERIRKKKPQVWQGYAGRRVYDLGLLPELLDWIEKDLHTAHATKRPAVPTSSKKQEDQRKTTIPGAAPPSTRTKGNDTGPTCESSGVPVTLEQFMKDYCERDNRGDAFLARKKQQLLTAAKHGKLELPCVATRWKSGQAKRFSPQDLTADWPGYRDVIPDLPLLKDPSTAKSE
jgi:hypothetical protein